MKEDFDKNRKFTKKDFQQTINNIKKSYKFVKNNKKSLIFCLLTSVLTIPVSILIPILSAKMVLDLNGSLYEDLLRIALFILIVYTIQHILGFGARILYKKYLYAS